MKKLILRVGLAIVILLVLGILIVAMYLGSIIKKGVETVGPTLTKTDVKLDSASLSLLSGSGSIKGFVLGNPEGYKGEFSMKVGRVDLGVQPGSVFSDKIHVTQIRVEAPEIYFDGNLLSPKNSNLGKIMDNVQAATGGTGTGEPAATKPESGKTPSKSQGAAKKLQVDDLLVTGGKIHLATALTAGKPLTLPLPEIHFTNLGDGPDGITAGELTKKVLSEVIQGTITEVAKNATKLGQGALDAAGGAAKSATDAAGKAVKGIGDLFKKK